MCQFMHKLRRDVADDIFLVEGQAFAVIGSGDLVDG